MFKNNFDWKSSFGKDIADVVDDMAVFGMTVVIGMTAGIGRTVGIERIRVGICFRTHNPVEAEERISLDGICF